MKLICIICSFVYTVLSTTVNLKGPCPNFQAVENFDLEKFGQGKWYEIGRYPNDILNRGDCVIVEYDYSTGRYNLTDVVNGNTNVLNGHFSLAPNAGTAGIINFDSSNITVAEKSDILPVHILDTDYDNYSVLYECRFDSATGIRHDLAWIYSRSRKLEDNARSALYNFLDSSPALDVNKFVWDHPTESICKSDV